MKSLLTLFLVAGLLLLFSCRDEVIPPKENKVLTRKAANYSGKLAQDWLQLTDQMIRGNHLAGPHAARIYGYVGLTLWEAVCGGIPEAKSLASQINGYNEPPTVDATKEYDWGIVMCTAMATVLPELMEQITSAQRDQIEVLAIIQVSQMVANGVSYEVREDSKNLGLIIGSKIVHRMQNDGRDVIRNITPLVLVRDTDHPWYWSPNTPSQQPVEPLWSTLRTFVLDNAQSCEAAAPYAYSELPGTTFYLDAQEVYQTDRTGVHRSIAYHWEDGVGRTSGPAGHWMNITTQLLQDSTKNLAICAKAYCLVGCTVADAFSASWYLKYKYNELLPATYLHEQFSASWKPLVDNPPFPDYTSASATVGGAVPLVLLAIFGEVAFVDRTQLGSALYTPDGGPFVLPEREFETLTKAGEEEAISGVFGGINFRRAGELGLQSGRCVGNTVLSRLHFGF
ncbi:MAG: vanadium-dependent haloperoxidase [Saprospiraceae bacterium]